MQARGPRPSAARETRRHVPDLSPAQALLSPLAATYSDGAIALTGQANELADNPSLKRSPLVIAHCWAFQAARMSAPVADHTAPWLWMRSSACSIAAMRCGTPLIQGLRDSATMRPPLLAASR